ncbi:MAG: ATPase domain-containing protein [Nanoarchaeota archaeon]
MKPAELQKKITAEISAVKPEGAYAFVLKPENYGPTIPIILSYFSNSLKLSGIYVSLNKPYKEISKSLKENKIDIKNILFIDGVSEAPSSNDNCISLEGNKSLTQLSLILTSACKNKSIRFIIFDSITTLLLVHNPETIQRFLHYFINKSRNIGMLLMVIIDEPNSNQLYPVLSQFCDKIIKI